MKWQIRRCSKCGRYTLKERCPGCDAETVVAHPPKFSPSDRYARLRQPPETKVGN